MASVLAQVGTFTSPASTGNQTVSLDSGIWGGESPKCVIVWSRAAKASAGDGVDVHSRMGFGVAIAGGSQAAISVWSVNGKATSNCYRRHTNAGLISMVLGGGGHDQNASLDSVGSNQFTLNWSKVAVVSVGAYHYLALGGDDVEVYLDEITSPTSTGNVAYTGVGFQPDALVSFGINEKTVPAATVIHSLLSIGLADSASSHSVCAYSRDSSVTSDTGRVQSGQAIHNVFGASATMQASLVSLDADGYTLNYTTAPADNLYAWILCIKAPSVAVITDTQKTSTGTKSTATGVPVPRAALLTHFMGAASASVEDDARIGIGALGASGNQASAGAMDEDGQSTTDADRYQDSDEVIQSYDHTQTLKAAGTGSFNGANLDLNWTTTDATAREWGGLVIGELATGSREWGIKTGGRMSSRHGIITGGAL